MYAHVCVCMRTYTRVYTRHGRRHYRGDYPGEGGHRWWNFMPRQCETLDPSSASSVSTFLRSFATTEWTRSFKLSVILRSLARSSIISLSHIVEIMSKKASAIYYIYISCYYILHITNKLTKMCTQNEILLHISYKISIHISFRFFFHRKIAS